VEEAFKYDQIIFDKINMSTNGVSKMNAYKKGERRSKNI